MDLILDILFIYIFISIKTNDYTLYYTLDYLTNSVDMRHLPSLNSLRAFEAAARHMSFTRAANELNVTSAAISQQIRSLEDWLGTPLFRRLTRAVRLTEAAQGVLPQISEAFDQLADVSAKLKADTDSTTLVVSAVPTFAAKWLVPRLSHFNDLYPDINVRIDTRAETYSGGATLEDFDRDDIHVAICLGDGNYPGMRVYKIVDEDVARKLAQRTVPRCPIAPVVTDNDVRGSIRVGALPFVPGTKDEADWRPSRALVTHRK